MLDIVDATLKVPGALKDKKLIERYKITAQAFRDTVLAMTGASFIINKYLNSGMTPETFNTLKKQLIDSGSINDNMVGRIMDGLGNDLSSKSLIDRLFTIANFTQEISETFKRGLMYKASTIAGMNPMDAGVKVRKTMFSFGKEQTPIGFQGNPIRSSYAMFNSFSIQQANQFLD